MNKEISYKINPSAYIDDFEMTSVTYHYFIVCKTSPEEAELVNTLDNRCSEPIW
jgi:hypothetical protein